MTVGELILLLDKYDKHLEVGIVNLVDDTGDSDELLTEQSIDQVGDKVIISHSKMEY